MKIVLIGGPGSGKGTRAKHMAKHLDLPHISTGDIFRHHLENKTEHADEIKSFIDFGNLVPDSLTIKLLKKRLEEDDCKVGFILDGFPRTMEQAKGMDIPEHVLFFDCHEDTLVDRLGNRLMCQDCKHIYNLKGQRPKVENKCDSCEGDLIQREDDKEEVIRDRLKVYKKQTEPVLDFFGNKVTKFDTGKEVEESVEEILTFLRKEPVV